MAAPPPREPRTAFGSSRPASAQTTGEKRSESDDRRQQERLSYVGGLRPAHTAGARSCGHQLVGDPHTDDGTDQGVGTGSRQTEVPSAEIPNDIYSALDNFEKAFEWLEKAYDDGSPDLIELNSEPIFDAMRNDRRFSDLMHRVGWECDLSFLLEERWSQLAAKLNRLT